MLETTRQAVRKGLALGVVAGLIFGVAETAGAALAGNPALMPVRMFASVVMGRPAMDPVTSAGTVVLVGSIAHLALSAVFGLIYALLMVRASRETQASLGRQALLGLGFGVALYLVNFQVIARLLYPWFLEMPQLEPVVMHAMLFGLPLGLLYAMAERKVHTVGGAISPRRDSR